MFARISVVVAGAAVLAAPALAQNVVQNPSFETPGPLGALGWQPFNQSRYRTAGDGLDPAVTPRTGNACIELPGGPAASSFQGFTTNTLNPATLEPFNPTVPIPAGDATVSGWYMIPADRPLVTARAAIKLEFFDFDPVGGSQILWAPFENLTIQGHTNGQWVQFSQTITAAQLAEDCNGVSPNRVAVLPMRFGAGETGTIFWDDIELTFGPPPCEREGDLTGDGQTDVFDLLAYLDIWFNETANPCP